MTKTMTVDEAKKNFHEVTAEIKSRKRVGVAYKIVEPTSTRKKSPVMAIIPWDEYEGLLETIDILQDKELMQRLRKSMDQEKAGRGIPWTEAKKKLGL